MATKKTRLTMLLRPGLAQGILAGIILLFLALVGRMAYINLLLSPKLKTLADQQQQGYHIIPANRGTIYDSKGRILAGTQILPSLYVDPTMIYDKNRTAEVLATYLSDMDVDAETILRQIDSSVNPRFVWVARGIPTGVADMLMRRDIQKELPGLGVQPEPMRVYTSGNLAGHILGAVNIDGKGLEGMELYYNDVLQGINGYEKFVRDAARRKIWLITSQCQAPVNGRHIILTIDSVVQQFTQKSLNKACEFYKSESGVAIVMDPRTGDVLAMAVYPEVNPNKFGSTDPNRRRNRAITDPFEPGSIFKPFVAVHALADGVVKMNDTIFCHNGTFSVGKRTLHDAHGHGTLTFPEVVQKSSNIGMAILGLRMGNSRLYQAVRLFGFGSKTGIDLPGEDPGIVLPFRRWMEIYSTTSVPMGQEIAATSMQLVTAFAALANDGLLLRPRFFRASIDETGQIDRENTEIERVRQVVPKEFAEIMVKDILRGTCTIGTGKRADIPGYQVFGKTGTAQIARGKHKGKGYEENAYVGSFLGGAPSSNPMVVALVSIRRPQKSIGYYGGTVAAPAVKEIMQAYFEYLHIPPVEQVDPNSPAGEAVSGD